MRIEYDITSACPDNIEWQGNIIIQGNLFRITSSFLDFDVHVSDDCVIVISDMNIETRIEFCEIKDIEVTDDMVKFILQDGGIE